MNISKIIALVAAVSTISIPAPAFAQELSEGQVVEGPCTTDAAFLGWGRIVSRGVRTQTINGEWVITRQIIGYRQCTPPQVVQVRHLPRQVDDPNADIAEYCGPDNTVWTNVGNRFYNPWSRDHQRGVPCQTTNG